MSDENNHIWPLIFELLSPVELRKINSNKLKVNFRVGEIIRKQGAPLTHIIVFVSGLAKLYIEGKGKNNIILRLIKSKQFIAGPGIYYDLRHHYSIKALADSCIYFIQADLIQEIISKNKKFGLAFNRELSKNTLITYDRLVNLTQKQMAGRMADLLFYLSNKVYSSKNFNNILSKNDMSELAGMSKDNVTRTLKDFQRRNILKISGNEIELVDIKTLNSISNQEII